MSLPEKIEAIDHAITVAELAALLHLGKTAVYDMVRRNAIPHYRLAGLRFDPQELADWLRSRFISDATRLKRKQR
jgi:excisionase family DNA binding protein